VETGRAELVVGSGSSVGRVDTPCHVRRVRELGGVQRKEAWNVARPDRPRKEHEVAPPERRVARRADHEMIASLAERATA
jgi:hypothetical protein